MKKVIALLALSAIIFSCSKQEEQLEVNEDGKQIITATVNVATKVAYSENTPGGGAGLGSVWEEGDSFKAIQDGAKVVTFNLVSGAGSTSATFQATTEGATSSTAWVAVLGNGARTSASGDHIECPYKLQSGTLAGLSNFNYVKANGSGLTPNFDFENGEKLSYIMRIKMPAGIKYIEFTPSAWGKVTAGEVTNVWYNGSDQNDYTVDNFASITLDSPTTEGQIIYLAIPPINYDRNLSTYASGEQNGNLKAAIVITIMNDVSANATKSLGAILETDMTGKGGLIGTFDMSTKPLLDRPKPSDAVTFNTTNVSVEYSGRKQAASNLSTHWAPFNLGASKSSEKGGYYSYGESFSKATPADFTFVKYTMRHNPKGGTFRDDVMTPVATKVVNNADNGEWYTVASSRYDAARVNWGKDWRMPRIVEALGLATKFTKTQTNVDGQAGIKVTYNTNELFFPFSGYYKEGTASDQDYVEFWTADKINRTYNEAGWNQAYCGWFNAGSGGTGMRVNHYYGLVIRPVLASSVIE